MRRGASLFSSLFAIVFVLAACGQPGAGHDLLFLGTPRGVALLDPGAASPTFRASAVPSRDWSTVVRAVSEKGSTRVVALNPSEGRELWARTLAGRMVVKVVSEDGDLVALAPARERYYGQGRARTKLVIAGPSFSQPRALTLEGNFEPEAFSTDGRNLFVLQYLPARAPTKYRVRRLDLAAGRVFGVYTVDAELQEAMRGTARVQAMSPDGKILYTLYTLRGPGGTQRAFIHVLNLEELWAHCIDLPSGFGDRTEAAVALAVAPSGRRLYAAHGVTGAVAEVDTAELRVLRTARINFGWWNTAQALHGPDRTLYLVSGRRISVVDISTLTERRSWLLPAKIRGIQAAEDGTRLYVAMRDEIAILDVVSGKRVGTLDPPGIGNIQTLGRMSRPLDEDRTIIKCAC